MGKTKKRVLLCGAVLLTALAGVAGQSGVRFGCAYYPEAWGPEAWEGDLRLMRETGIDLIRIGEFNWGKFEPEEGVFDFSEYDAFLDLCEKHGVKVMMCTPTAAVPRWMHARYPETEKTCDDGSPVPNGSRQSSCANSPKFRFFAERIVRKMAEAFRDKPAVERWQLDNELHIVAGTKLCVCPACTAGFQGWLRRRYGTIEELNRAWNGSFWSGSFAKWTDIVPPFRFRAAWKRQYVQYQSDGFISLVLSHRDILRAANPRWRITTNGSEMSGWIRLDDLYRELGYAACDTYCSKDALQRASWMWNLSRGLAGGRKPWTVAETGAFNWSGEEPDADEAIVPWFWGAFLRGAEDYCFFRWRHSVLGEDDHPAILPWSGRPGRLHARVKALISDYRTRGRSLTGMPAPSSVAVVHDAASDQFELVRHNKIQFGPYEDTNMLLCETLERHGIIPDVVPVSAPGDWSNHKVVYLPYCEMPTEALREKLRAFVRNGGTAVAVLRLDNVDPVSGQYLKVTTPAGLKDVFGLEIAESRAFDWKDWACELVVPTGCEVLERFTTGCYRGEPLLTRHAFGKGRAYYRAGTLDEQSAVALVRQTLEAAGVAVGDTMPRNVNRFERDGKAVYLNHTSTVQAVPGQDRPLAPYEVRVVELTRGE